MSRASYGTIDCNICGEWIGRAGFAKASHMKKHIRNGEAFAVVCRDKNGDTTTSYHKISELEDQRKRLPARQFGTNLRFHIVDAAYLENSMKRSNDYLKSNGGKPVCRGSLY